MAEAETKRQFSELCKTAKQQANVRQQAGKLSQAKVDAFSGLINLAEDLSEFRNDAVHASWTTDSNGQPLRIRPKWDKSTRSVEWNRNAVVPLSEFQSIREQIERLYQDLNAERKTW